MTGARLHALARVLGAGFGLTAAAAWLFLWVERPWGALGIATPPAALVTAIFVGLALAGVGAALRDASVVLALVGFFSLVPVGLYFLLAPGFLPVIGWCDVGMLAAGIVMLAADRAGGTGGRGCDP